jgi:pyrrolysine biosynthesis protein PylC
LDANPPGKNQHRSIQGEDRVLVAIVGGNLQGVEATYLAHKAGWNVRLIDRNARPPAAGLSDTFVQADVISAKDLSEVFAGVDLIIPALEEDAALDSLNRWSREQGVPLAFDADAYAISSSKLASAELFRQIGTPVPAAWPQCGFPVVAKPSSGSGSRGVSLFRNLDALMRHFSPSLPAAGWVLQEYLEGTQHSLEVVGMPGRYHALQVTDLYVDADYDCKRVVAPTELSPERVAEFEKLALVIAEALNLHGIMDVEAILHAGQLKVLEIDARLPSQTPTAVYWSTGQNMLHHLAELFQPNFRRTHCDPPPVRGSVYEHILLREGWLQISGEHIMTGAGPLYLRPDFFGADEAITNFDGGMKSWVATLMITGPDRAGAWAKRDLILGEIIERLALKGISDPLPAG